MVRRRYGNRSESIDEFFHLFVIARDDHGLSPKAGVWQRRGEVALSSAYKETSQVANWLLALHLYACRGSGSATTLLLNSLSPAHCANQFSRSGQDTEAHGED